MPVNAAGSNGAAQIAKLLKDAPGGQPVKVTVKQFEGLSSELVKIASANPEIAKDIANLLQTKSRTGDFDISDITAIPSHRGAVSNAVSGLLSKIEKATSDDQGSGGDVNPGPLVR